MAKATKHPAPAPAPAAKHSAPKPPAPAPAHKPADPIEAAKIQAPQPASVPPPQPAVVLPPSPAVIVPPAPPPPAQPAPEPRKPYRKARVKTTKLVSINGQITKLPAGTVVSEDSYGPGIFERLSDAKVELEPME